MGRVRFNYDENEMKCHVLGKKVVGIFANRVYNRMYMDIFQFKIDHITICKYVHIYHSKCS
jgi:hypothetical protein